MRTKKEALALVVRNLLVVAAGGDPAVGQQRSLGALTDLGFSITEAESAWHFALNELNRDIVKGD